MAGIGNRIVLSLLARDLKETIDFYVTKFNFQVTGHHPNLDEPKWIELSRDGIALQFFAEPPIGMATQPVFSGTVYFYPESVLDLAEELSGKVNFEWGPEVMDYGMREFGIKDPNGYFLAFTEPTK
jgi:catechol 2,3-dioxygenase-like lactoylglutathione lyase family enzyme